MHSAIGQGAERSSLDISAQRQLQQPDAARAGLRADDVLSASDDEQVARILRRQILGDELQDGRRSGSSDRLRRRGANALEEEPLRKEEEQRRRCMVRMRELSSSFTAVRALGR